jgi:LmbE family N-acetylglucosaminyl deacetylase
MRIAIIAAHPDDETLGCGGTIARLSAEHEVHVMILGEGITSRYDGPNEGGSAEVVRLHEHAREAGRLMNVASVDFDNLPDNRFDESALLDVVKRIEGRLDALQPEVVYTHHAGDLNVDHAITCRAVLTATRPQPGMSVREVYCFEVPSSTEWTFHRLEPVFRPNVFIDISGTIDTKISAMEAYEGEIRTFPHPRSVEAIRSNARRWGSVVGVDWAEAFELVRAIR